MFLIFFMLLRFNSSDLRNALSPSILHLARVRLHLC